MDIILSVEGEVMIIILSDPLRQKGRDGEHEALLSWPSAVSPSAAGVIDGVTSEFFLLQSHKNICYLKRKLLLWILLQGISDAKRALMMSVL